MDLIFDVIYCDIIEFVLEENASSRAFHASMHEAARAHCKTIGIELLDFEHVVYQPINGKLKISIFGGSWLKNYKQR